MVSIATIVVSSVISDYYYPQMIHISLTGVKGEMAVDWISSCNATTPSYGTQYTVYILYYSNFHKTYLKITYITDVHRVSYIYTRIYTHICTVTRWNLQLPTLQGQTWRYIACFCKYYNINLIANSLERPLLPLPRFLRQILAADFCVCLSTNTPPVFCSTHAPLRWWTILFFKNFLIFIRPPFVTTPSPTKTKECIASTCCGPRFRVRRPGDDAHQLHLALRVDDPVGARPAVLLRARLYVPSYCEASKKGWERFPCLSYRHNCVLLCHGVHVDNAIYLCLLSFLQALRTNQSRCLFRRFHQRTENQFGLRTGSVQIPFNLF